MKYKVIKEYAGIEVGSEVKLSESNAKYLISQGYVELVIEPIEPIKATVTSNEGGKLELAQNKAIEPKYKRNKSK